MKHIIKTTTLTHKLSAYTLYYMHKKCIKCTLTETHISVWFYDRVTSIRVFMLTAL